MFCHFLNSTFFFGNKKEKKIDLTSTEFFNRIQTFVREKASRLNQIASHVWLEDFGKDFAERTLVELLLFQYSASSELVVIC